MAITINQYPNSALSPEPGGNQSALAVSGAAAVNIVPQAIRVRKIIVLSAPASAASFNDANSVANSNSNNQVISIPTTAPIGVPIVLDWPCVAGLTLSNASGGSFSISLG